MTYPLTKKVCQLYEQGIYAGQTDLSRNGQAKRGNTLKTILVKQCTQQQQKNRW